MEFLIIYVRPKSAYVLLKARDRTFVPAKVSFSFEVVRVLKPWVLCFIK